MNIDGCRVHRDAEDVPGWHKTGSYGRTDGFLGTDTFKIRDMPPEEVQARCGNKGRWPPHLLLSHTGDCVRVGTTRVKGCPQTVVQGGKEGGGYDVGSSDGTRHTEFQGYGDAEGMEEVEVWECGPNCPVAELNRQSGNRPGCKSPSKARCESKFRPEQGAYQPQGPIYGDQGGASRYFPTFQYQAKPSKAERNEGLDEPNDHSTVKSIPLMRWLLRLITPPGGLVIDPFLGSGSTGCAAVLEQFRFLGCDENEHYCEIARQRIAHWSIK